MNHIIYLILFTIILTGCSYQEIKNEAPQTNDVTSGEKFRITLPENHTTGYMWQLNNNFDDKVLDYYGSVFHGNEKGVDFNFKTLNKGQTTLNFALIKYRDTSATKQFIVNVK